MRVDSSDDATIVDEARRDPSAFATIFDRHADAIHRYVRRRVGPDAADDAVMATFVAAFEARTSFIAPDHRSARPWLFGIAANVVKRHHRTSRRQQELRERLGSQRPATADLVGVVDDLLTVATALDALPDDDRETLLMVALGEMSYDETAEALEIPVGTVRSRVNRARTRVRADVAGSAGGAS